MPRFSFRKVQQLFSDPAVFTVPAPVAMTNTVTMSQAENLSELISATPTSAAAFTTRTGTQLDSAFARRLAIGDGWYQTINNLATGAGEDITLTAGVGVSAVGDMVVDAQDADGNNATGLFFYRKSATNTFVIYRIA